MHLVVFLCSVVLVWKIKIQIVCVKVASIVDQYGFLATWLTVLGSADTVIRAMNAKYIGGGSCNSKTLLTDFHKTWHQ